MIEQSTHSEVSTTTTSKRLEERLNRHPELKARIETLLSVVENAEGDPGIIHFSKKSTKMAGEASWRLEDGSELNPITSKHQGFQICSR